MVARSIRPNPNNNGATSHSLGAVNLLKQHVSVCWKEAGEAGGTREQPADFAQKPRPLRESDSPRCEATPPCRRTASPLFSDMCLAAFQQRSATPRRRTRRWKLQSALTKSASSDRRLPRCRAAGGVRPDEPTAGHVFRQVTLRLRLRFYRRFEDLHFEDSLQKVYRNRINFRSLASESVCWTQVVSGEQLMFIKRLHPLTADVAETLCTSGVRRGRSCCRSSDSVNATLVWSPSLDDCKQPEQLTGHRNR